MERSLLAGRVGRPHGLDGSFYVTGARPALLAAGMSVALAGRVRPIVRRAGTDQRPIVRVEGCEDRDAAETLRGQDLLVDAAVAPPLPAGEWWAEEFAGCRVLDGATEVGVVRRMLALPSCECLEVARAGAPDLLVPLVRDAVRSVDVQARLIDVDLAFLGERNQ
jgi:16S rRNA processing protein RimM